MSTEYFHKTWKNAVEDLEDQLKFEGVIKDNEEEVSLTF